MKKWLSIALLLFSIAAPSATYSVEEEASHNIQKTSTSTTIETKKADNLKPATLKRRFYTVILDILFNFSLLPKIHLFLKYFTKYVPEAYILPTWISGEIWSVVDYALFYFFDEFEKYILNLKVVDISGKEATFQQKMIRFFIKHPPFMLLEPVFGKVMCKRVLLVWLLAMGISTVVAEDGRGFPDRMANTTVVQKASAIIETKKADNLKPATLKRRCCAYFLGGLIFLPITIYVLVSAFKKANFDDVQQGDVKQAIEALWKAVPDWVKNPYYKFIGDCAYHINSYLLLRLSRYILGIKIVDISGEEASRKQQMIRFFIKQPPFFLLGLFMDTGWLESLYSLIILISTVAAEDGRGFPDRMANTVVVKVEKNGTAVQKQ